MADESDDTVVPMRRSKQGHRKPARPQSPVPPGPFFSPSLLPTLERYVALLNRYGQRPGETGAADIMARMHPGDRQEAGQLSEILEPVLGPRILAAREAPASHGNYPTLGTISHDLDRLQQLTRPYADDADDDLGQAAARIPDEARRREAEELLRRLRPVIGPHVDAINELFSGMPNHGSDQD